MQVRVAPWPNDVDSPVIFMIDDLANVWIDTNRNGRVDWGEDWGYAQDSEGSSLKFLEEQILARFPDVKVTFFVTVGERAPVIRNGRYPCYARPINATDESKIFFKRLHDSYQYELAYHGLTHGIPGTSSSKEFVQEWVSYRSLEEAIRTIEEGKRIYFDVCGEFPKGGKYCGFVKNAFSDKSIEDTGFLWCCREWSRGMSGIPDEERFAVKYFGQRRVIHIPCTVSGGVVGLRPTLATSHGVRRYLGYWRSWFRMRWQVTKLLYARQVVSIQEHIAPSREDGVRQRPNIFDDKESLLSIFRFLAGKNVWYATGTEVAEYFEARENIQIRVMTNNMFQLQYTGRVVDPSITLVIDLEPVVETRANTVLLVDPDGQQAPCHWKGDNAYMVSTWAKDGIYEVRVGNGQHV